MIHFNWAGRDDTTPLKVDIKTVIWNTQADHDAGKDKIETRGYKFDYDRTSNVDIVEQAEDWIIANDADYASATKV